MRFLRCLRAYLLMGSLTLLLLFSYFVLDAKAQQATQIFFHSNRLRTDLSAFGVSSAELVYEWADPSLPSRPSGSPEVVTLSSRIKGDEVRRVGIQLSTTKTPDGRDVFFAYIAWLSPTLTGLEET